MSNNRKRLILRERTVFRQHTAYVITLPIEWVRTHGIREGDKISPLVLEDGSLLLEVQKEG
jgi:bifunctional DNA-binding transcriptional regulator/antitoxin component of YhaV-PrlF toxin-antitoxin module